MVFHIAAGIIHISLKNLKQFFQPFGTGAAVSANERMHGKNVHFIVAGDVFTPWNAVYGAWRQPGAVYLYVQQNRAYLLPAGQANVPEEEVWHFLRQSLPEERLHEKPGR